MKRPTFRPAARQRGAALVVGLVLLLVLTLLAISGMNTATVELQMAGNTQFSQNAFQAAETGIELVLESGDFDTTATIVNTPTLPSGDTVRTTTTFNEDNGISAVPAGGFSMGVGTGFSAFHFDITSTAQAARGATSTQMQSFYVVGQGN